MFASKMCHTTATWCTVLLLLSHANCQSLFDAVDVEGDARPLNVGVNLPPKFLPGGDMVGFSLPEDTPVGAIVYRLRGEDPEGSRVGYSISGDHLSVVRNTGAVTLVKPLDHETMPELEVIITLTDEKGPKSEPNIVSIRREIPVTDRNDNAPKFSDSSYLILVNETAAVNTQIFNKILVTDADSGSNSEVKLTCLQELSPDGCAKFDVRAQRISQGKFAGVLTVRSKLNYEERNRFTLVLKAEDSAVDPEPRLSSTATITLEVVDVQDQSPVFLNTPYYAVVEENSKPGVQALSVKVRDGDTGQPRNLLLEIVDDPFNYFKIESFQMENGIGTAKIVTTENPIDRENDVVLARGGVYIFKLKATELSDGQPTRDITFQEVTAIVKDVNDQPPVFNQEQYTVGIPENLGIGEAIPGLDMMVSDSDSGINSHFGLELVPVQNADNVFEIFPMSAMGKAPIQIKVTGAEALDYENPSNREMVVHVVARGGALQMSSTATLTILLIDVNDNKPMFQQQSYHFRVVENTAAGTLIKRLTADDADSGEFGDLRYEVHGYGSERFLVNATTGDFSVGFCGPSPCLDFEDQDSYTLTYTATDGGGRATSVQVIVTIEDVNDNPPLFEQSQYKRHILNRALVFDPPLVIKATDKDGTRKGQAASLHKSKVFYSIESGNKDGLFVIDRDEGVIELNRRANVSELGERFLLKVRATDSGTPPQYTDTIVTISVGSVEGNDPPIFQREQYQVDLVEQSPAETFVIQLNATDPDGPSDRLLYRIAGGTFVDWFAIDETTGVVRIAPGTTLQWDQENPVLSLTVAAIDQGQPLPQTATTTVTIHVEDINDKPPSFSKKLFVHHVAEVTSVGTQVLVLAANDPDTNSQLKFRLMEPFQTRNKWGYLQNMTTGEYFTITESTGILTLSKPLDHENAAVVMFHAEVTDINADAAFPNQTDTAEVVIYVQAHTDNEPIFSSPWSPAHPVIRTEIAEEREPGIILLTLQAHDPLTGVLINRFEMVEMPKEEATTKAPPSTDIALESLFESISPSSDSEAANDTAPQRRDPDITSLIELNKLTGEITVKSRIDYEELINKTLRFGVKAMAGEGESERVSRATLELEIIDTNDNSPIFSQEEYRVRVTESIRYPEALVTVTATDKDSGKFGQIQYTVSGDGADLFVIDDPSSGVIRVAPNVSLDREKQPSYSFTVIAADQPQGSEEQKRSSALVIVEVSDVNDNAPTFTQSSYTAVVPENAPLDWSVSQVEALDPDEDAGGKVEYVLAGEGRLEGLLSVEPNRGTIIVKGPLTGRGRSEPYVLTVRAQDQGDPPLFTDIDVNVYVGDITANDGVPSFVKPAFNEQAFVVEEAPVGTVVFQALAMDPDDPATPNGRLTYKFLDDGALGADHAFFEIHPVTGIITTKARLDRETKSSYSLILIARDQGNPFQQATRKLQVVVRDIDDHPPQFIRTPYDGPLQFSVLEEVELDWVVDTLKAFDPDQGENAAIDYLITYGDDAGVFALERNPDNSARLVRKGRIDRELVDSYLLTVKCFKPAQKPSELRKPYNPEDMSEIQVKVTIKDADDNDPVFSQLNISTGVRLNAPLHTEVVRLHADDPDAESGPVFYRLVNVSFIRASYYGSNGGQSKIDTSPAVARSFDLDAATGSLTTSQTYGLFVDGYFLIHVYAWTGQDESLSRKAYNTLRVYILRDSELLKFVFSKPPPEVKPILSEFRESVEQNLNLSLTLNLYESQFYTRDGALDFSSTSSCFQLVGKDRVIDTKETELLLNERNHRLRSVYEKYGVGNVERCVPRGALYEINNLEIWLLVIGCMVGVIAVIATLTTCCLFTRYESRMRKLHPGVHIASRVAAAQRRASFAQSHASAMHAENHYEGQSTLARSVL